MALGRRVRAFRESRGLSQEVLAQALGIEAATLSRYETARLDFPLDLLARISAEVGTTLTNLVDVGQPAPSADEGAEILAAWRRIDRSRRNMALRVLREIARR